MHKNFFHDTLSYNPELLQAMLQFNTDRVRLAWQVDTKHKNEPAGEAALSLLEQRCRKLPEYRRKNLQKNTEAELFFWDFRDEVRRLALLDVASIHKIMLYMGVSVHAAKIVQCVSNKEVLALRDGLGEEAYTFAIHRGQFALGGINKKLFDFLQEEDLYPRIVLSGIFFLYFCIDTMPTLLYNILWEHIESFAKKQQIEIAVVNGYIEGLADDRATKDIAPLCFGMKKILLKEIDSKWKPYFNA